MKSLENKKLVLIKKAIESEFAGWMGFEKTVKTFYCGLDTPLMVEVEAVNGFVNRESKPANVVYIWHNGVRYRYNGKRWEKY